MKPAQIRLVAGLDVSSSNPGATEALLAAASRQIREATPDTQVETAVANRPMLHELLEQSENADLMVVGSSPDPGIRELRSPSFPVSLAARSRCVVAVVPDDWEAGPGSVVVGVDATDGSHEAAVFAAREAVDAARELVIVHTWEPWAAPNARAELFVHESIIESAVDRIRADFPSLSVRGVLKEAVAHDGIIANAGDAHLIVLGTYRLGRESGVVLGAIHQELMIHGRVALCIVPLVDATGELAG